MERKIDIYHILGKYQEAIEPYLDILSYPEGVTTNPLYHLKYITNNKLLLEDPRFKKIIAEHKGLYEENLKKYGILN